MAVSLGEYVCFAGLKRTVIAVVDLDCTGGGDALISKVTEADEL